VVDDEQGTSGMRALTDGPAQLPELAAASNALSRWEQLS
jgi:hypothetical protein